MERQAHLSIRYIPLSLFLGGMLYFVQGCGVAGPPLPPEEIGIEAKIRSQQQAEEGITENGQKEIVPIDQEGASLPSLQPIGAQ